MRCDDDGMVRAADRLGKAAYPHKLEWQGGPGPSLPKIAITMLQSTMHRSKLQTKSSVTEQHGVFSNQ
jgi:hypothetical protein